MTLRRSLPWLGSFGLMAVVVLAWRFNRLSEPGPKAYFGRYWLGHLGVNLLLTYGAFLMVLFLALKGSARSRCVRLTVLTMSLLFVLGVGEVPTLLGQDWRRTFGGNLGMTWLERSVMLNRFDPELLHIHEPHGEYDAQVEGNLAGLGIPDPPLHRVRVRYDRNGFRNDEDLDGAPIVVIGDSFVEGALVEVEATLPRKLGSHLSAKAANLGQAAYGLRQELTVLKRYGLPLKPRVVVWCFFGGNDLRDVEEFERGLAAGARLAQPPSFLERSLWRNLLTALSRKLCPPQRDGATAASQSGWVVRQDGTEERVYFGHNTLPWNPHQWQVCTDTLGEAADLCRAAQVGFLVVYIPRKFTVYGGLMKVPPSSELLRWTRTDLPETLGRWCQGAGIPFCDTTGPLRRDLEAGFPPYFPDDVHWNERGHATAAAAVAEALGAAGLWPR